MSDQSVVVSIEGMTCGSCVYKVESELSDLEGVTSAKVDLQAKRGTFTYNASSKVNADLIVKTINDLGFKAKLVSHLLH